MDNRKSKALEYKLNKYRGSRFTYGDRTRVNPQRLAFKALRLARKNERIKYRNEVLRPKWKKKKELANESV